MDGWCVAIYVRFGIHSDAVWKNTARGIAVCLRACVCVCLRVGTMQCVRAWLLDLVNSLGLVTDFCVCGFFSRK